MSVPEPVCTFWRTEKILGSVGNRTHHHTNTITHTVLTIAAFLLSERVKSLCTA